MRVVTCHCGARADECAEVGYHVGAGAGPSDRAAALADRPMFVSSPIAALRAESEQLARDLAERRRDDDRAAVEQIRAEQRAYTRWCAHCESHAFPVYPRETHCPTCSQAFHTPRADAPAATSAPAGRSAA